MEIARTLLDAESCLCKENYDETYTLMIETEHFCNPRQCIGWKWLAQDAGSYIVAQASSYCCQFVTLTCEDAEYHAVHEALNWAEKFAHNVPILIVVSSPKIACEIKGTLAIRRPERQQLRDAVAALASKLQADVSSIAELTGEEADTCCFSCFRAMAVD